MPTPNLPTRISEAINYGPQVQQAVSRSQYLADALKALQADSGKITGGWGELGSRVLANAILQRKSVQADSAAVGALGAQRDSESEAALAGLRPPVAAETPVPAPPAPAPQPAPAIAPPVQLPPAAPQAQPRPTSARYSPQDRDALALMLATEAGGEGSPGMIAAGHVALNRLKAGYGAAKSLHDVVYAPHQFEGITRGHNPDPQTMAGAQQVADQILSGQTQDPTGGAMAFLNPDLQIRMGRAIPKWAQGDGLRIGNHVFFGGGQRPADAPPQNIDQPGPVSDQPYQVASNGPTPPPPSAPVLSPPAAGPPPAGVPPQASPAGGMADWPTWKPAERDLDYVRSLLNSRHPGDHERGLAEAAAMRKKMTEPVEAQITMINGAPFYVPKDPTAAAQTRPIPIPKEALTQTMAADGVLPGAPHGLYLQRDPLGKLTEAPGAPPPGYEVGADGKSLQYRRGGPDDPTLPQKPSAGYQYGPGGQTPVAGGPADPRAPMNVAAGTERIQAAIHPILNLVTKAKQSAGAVQEGYRLQNGTGDIAMVNGLQHLIDDGVVRGEDVNMQMKSSGVSGSFGQIAQFVNSGGLLTPEIRAKVLQASKGLFNSIDQQYKAQVLSHRATTDALYGPGAFDRYVMPLDYQRSLGWAAPDGAPTPAPPATPQQQPQLQPGTREAAIAEAKKRGLIP